MKICIPNESKQGIGGGWSFRDNLTKGLKQEGVKVVDKWHEADIILVLGPTIVSKDSLKLDST